MIEIKEYVSKNDKSPFRHWFDELDPHAAASVTTAIRRLSEGNASSVKSIGEGAAELKINRGPGYRVYFGWEGKVLVILWAAASSVGNQTISKPHCVVGVITSFANPARGADSYAVDQRFSRNGAGTRCTRSGVP